MAKIEVKDINLDGSELFADSESFIDELNEDIVEGLNGGKFVIKPITTPKPITIKPYPFPYPCPWTPVIL